MATTEFRITCLCKRCDFTTQVPTETLPIPADICQCDSCRHSLGTLFSASCAFPPAAFHEIIESQGGLLSKYASSRCTDYFCSTCGSHMFLRTQARGSEHVNISIGTLHNAEKLVKLNAIYFVGDTKDGGASKWMSVMADGSKLKLLRRGENSVQLPHGWPDIDGYKARETVVGDSLPAHCHCQGVRFNVTKEKSGKAYIGGGRPENPEPGEEDAGIWIWNDEGEDRIKASVCGCDSCRLGCATDLMPWSFIHKKNIWPVGNGDGKKSLQDLSGSKIGKMQFGTLKAYNSSPEVWRYFCGNCGATVFFEDEERPLVLDVAMGLFNAESGALGLDWFRWSCDYVRNMDDVKHVNLVKGADQGLKDLAKMLGAGYQLPQPAA